MLRRAFAATETQEPAGWKSSVLLPVLLGVVLLATIVGAYAQEWIPLPVSDPPTREPGKPYIVGRHFYVDGRKLYLRGVNKAGGGRLKGLHEYERDYRVMASQGINVVRRHFRAELWLGREAYRQLFVQNIEWARKHGMYFIMDLYSYGSEGRTDAMPAPTKRQWIALWEDVARHCKDYPNVIYEIANEPHGRLHETYYWLWAQEVVDAIRVIDLETIIIVPIENWAHDARQAVANPIRGRNIAYDFHVYLRFTRSVGSLKTSVTRWMRDQHILAVLEDAPIICGEFGVDTGYASDQLGFFRSLLDVMTQYEMSWMAYSWDRGVSGFYLIEDWDGTWSKSGIILADYL